jgi:hypothetical protein
MNPDYFFLSTSGLTMKIIIFWDLKLLGGYQRFGVMFCATFGAKY